MDSSLSIRRGEAADTDAVLALWRGEGVTPSPTGYERDPAMVRYVSAVDQRRTASTP